MHFMSPLTGKLKKEEDKEDKMAGWPIQDNIW